MENVMRKKTIKIKDDLCLVICGSAGQGIQTVERILTQLLKGAGFHIFGTKEYMSRVRGGSNSTEIRVSSTSRPALLDRIDLLIPLNQEALEHVRKRISADTLILADKDQLGLTDEKEEARVIDIPFSRLAKEMGGAIYANSVAAGLVAQLFNLDLESITHFLNRLFVKSKPEILENNRKAAEKGFDIGRGLVEAGEISIHIESHPNISEHILINGAEAVGIGAIAGGCNFISSYPMSPSTPVLVFLSEQAEKFGIISEQAEDEISAVNMMLGAWYAGARAMVTTSGGGFALMEEGVSLAGVMESPAVIHLAQRPGPGTGLPTRTAQGDLQLALYSGHGDFPRIILAPGRLEEAVYLTRDAFRLAAKFQVPVFILTDQYFIDSYYSLPALDFQDKNKGNEIIETDGDYKRYRITENGISPRGVPAYGKGFVVTDSDEHDEDGHITEDLHMRVAMVDKRKRKMREMEKEAFPPELIGKDDYHTLLIGWGSTCPIIQEAWSLLGKDEIAFLHFKQVYPLHPDTSVYLRKAKKRIVIEGNSDAQFASLLRLQTHLDIHETILKYNGAQFSVEELTERLDKTLGKKDEK
jgi:2-oxoglutarate ferredoxin oxidoreductase subunit alpha